MTTDHPTPPAYGPGSPYADMEARIDALERVRLTTPDADLDAVDAKIEALDAERREYRRTYPMPPVRGFVLHARLVNVPEGMEEIAGAAVPIAMDAVVDAMRAALPAKRWALTAEVIV